MPGRSLRVVGIPFSSPRGRDPGDPASPGPFPGCERVEPGKRSPAQKWFCPQRVLRSHGEPAVPMRIRLPPGEAVRDPKARVAGRPGIRVTAESTCGPPRWLGLPPRGASFEAAPKGQRREGALSNSQGRQASTSNFSQVPSPPAGRRAGTLVRRKGFFYVSTEVSRSHYFLTGWFRPLPPPFPATSPRTPSDLSEFAPRRGSQPGAGQADTGSCIGIGKC